MAQITSGPEPSGAAPPAPRYTTARSVVITDRVMAFIIRGGGIGIIVAVFGIFLFILAQIIPLFTGARVEPSRSHPLPPGAYTQILVDEWSERPMLLDRDGVMRFIDLGRDTEVDAIDLAERLGAPITAARSMPAQQELIVGTADGQLALVHIEYTPTFGDSGQRDVVHSVEVGKPVALQGGAGGAGRVVDVAYGDAGATKLAAALTEDPDGARRVKTVTFRQKQSLIGPGELVVEKVEDVTPLLNGLPRRLLVPSRADGIIVLNDDDTVDVLARGSTGFSHHQSFRPFEDDATAHIASADFILGDAALAFVDGNGRNRIFTLFAPGGTGPRLWHHTRTLPDLPGASQSFAKSLRNKSFLLTAGPHASLRQATTADVRWSDDLPFTPVLSVISGKNDRILLVDTTPTLHEYTLDDPHAEASLKAFFGRVWYEGASSPRFEWQSSGATDDAEPKLSMVPLIIGSLKGTFYALLFAVPIALTAALYTSQFAHWKVRSVVKPLMEIMASLPSVVLGFLAALWLAPIIETRVPTVLLVVLLVPAGAFLIGMFWHRVPMRVRNRMGLYGELLILGAVLLVMVAISIVLGPIVEQAIFVTTDPVTGERVADFRYWWPAVTGADFEQRNSLVVGFMMGFAVIPIIFTISEDALSNVPQNLRSGSLALGASRWQTAIRVVLPTASAGIFSALMVGLGRAVGETMIVLMATGNTPIMDFNIFSGMRTLSANIATELPEAPHNSTLYRSLFLGAMLLFLMTFLVNTVAEVLRQHLRNRYRTA